MPTSSKRESLKKVKMGHNSWIAMDGSDSLKGDESMMLSPNHLICIKASKFVRIVTCI